MHSKMKTIYNLPSFSSRFLLLLLLRATTISIYSSSNSAGGGGGTILFVVADDVVGPPRSGSNNLKDYYPKWEPEYFGNSATENHRTNVCEQNRLYTEGKVRLLDSLSGMQLSVLIQKNDHFTPIDATNALDPYDKGLTVRMLNEVAKLGNFTWKETFSIAEPSVAFSGNNSDKGYSDLLLWGVENYDIYANWWTHSSERMRKGILFPKGWVDSDLVLIGKDPNASHNKSQDYKTYINFLLPFTYTLWGVLILTLLISGLIYQFLEFGYQSMYDDPIDGLYLSFMVYVGQFQYEPNKKATKLFTVSFAFWSFIIASTYTAELASFFVTKNVTVDIVSNIEEAISSKKRFCVRAGAFEEDHIMATYEDAILVSNDQGDAFSPFVDLKNKRCDYIITTENIWNEARLNFKSYNKDCDLLQIGERIVSVQSGFAVLSDTGDKCTSLIRDNLNLLFSLLTAELEKMNAKYYSTKVNGTKCDGSGVAISAEGGEQSEDSDGDGDNAALEIKNLLGTFGLHYFLIIIAIIWAYFEAKKEVKSRSSKLKMTGKTEASRNHDDKGIENGDTNIVSGHSEKPVEENISSNKDDNTTTVIPGIKDQDLMINLIEMRMKIVRMKEMEQQVLKLMKICSNNMKQNGINNSVDVSSRHNNETSLQHQKQQEMIQEEQNYSLDNILYYQNLENNNYYK